MPPTAWSPEHMPSSAQLPFSVSRDVQIENNKPLQVVCIFCGTWYHDVLKTRCNGVSNVNISGPNTDPIIVGLVDKNIYFRLTFCYSDNPPPSTPVYPSLIYMSTQL